MLPLIFGNTRLVKAADQWVTAQTAVERRCTASVYPGDKNKGVTIHRCFIAGACPKDKTGRR
jgi:hypothetical protein